MSNSNLIKIFGAPIYMAHSLISENEINLLTKECFNLKKQIKKGGENWKSDVYNTLGTYDLRKNKTVVDNIISCGEAQRVSI